MLDGYGPVNITGAVLHAHFLGKNLSLAQYRNGKFIRYIAKDDVFSYNNPTSTNFNPPVTLFPGDELRTTCIYDTRKKTTTTYYGDGTYDEMCFAFMNYYPRMNISRRNLCLSYERYETFQFEDRYPASGGRLGGHFSTPFSNVGMSFQRLEGHILHHFMNLCVTLAQLVCFK